MKYFSLVFLILLVLIVGCNSGDEHAQQSNNENVVVEEQPQHEHVSTRPEVGNQAMSPNRMAMATIGDTHIVIEYSAPSVREREIWGEIVSFDRIWVSGAHMATSIEFPNDLVFHGEHVPAGKYALFTIPSEDTWTVILNQNWDQHLAGEYDQELDVLRITVTPEPIDFTEQLNYEITETTDGTGEITLAWEKLMIRIPVSAAH